MSSLTGGSVIAIAYNGGVALATDRVVFSGNNYRFQNNTRQYRLNKYCLVTFSGDFANFQWLQNLLERHQMELQIDAGMEYLKPKMAHAFLNLLFYQRRTKMNPLFNTVVVCGMQQVEFQPGKLQPFIGIIDVRGNAFETDHISTEMGSYLLHQLLETRQEQVEGANKMSREDALDVIAEAIEVSVTRNCRSGTAFDVASVDATDGVKFHGQIKKIGKWAVADACDGTYN